MAENDARAIAAFKESAAMNPTEEVWEKVGATLSKFGQYEEATALFKVNCEESPNSATFHLLLGAAYWDQTEYQKAIQEYQRAVTLDPRLVRGYYLMASGQNLLGDQVAARKSLEKALFLDPDFLPAQQALVEILIAGNRRQEAIQVLERMAVKNAIGVESQLKLGQLYLENGQLEASLKVLEAAERSTPHDKRVHYLLGRVYTACNQPERAQEEFAVFSDFEKAEMEEQKKQKPVR